MSSRLLLSARYWARLRQWYRTHGRHELPWRHDRSPWKVLLAETLLHRTRAEIAAVIYPKLVSELPSPAAVVERPARWRELMRPAGLAWRAETFLATCRVLVEKHHGQVPEDLQALVALPGVGHYVAQAVLCFGFGRRAVIVDTNTIRLAARISGEALNPAHHRSRAVHQMVRRLGPGAKAPDAEDNLALLDLAGLVCQARAPRCGICPIQAGCVTGLSTLLATQSGSKRLHAR